MWKATIRYEGRDLIGTSIAVEEIIKGDTVECQMWAKGQDLLWIGSGEKTMIVPMSRLICIIKEKID